MCLLLDYTFKYGDCVADASKALINLVISRVLLTPCMVEARVKTLMSNCIKLVFAFNPT